MNNIEIARSNFFDGLSKIEDYFEHVESQISMLDNEGLKLLYEYLTTINNASWKAQCAVIHEAKTRRIDMKSIASEFNISVAQAYRDAQIYEVFLSSGNIHSIEDKTFYQLALSADSPVDAINHAESRKMSDPSYSTRDFRKYIKSSSGSRKQIIVGEKDMNYFNIPPYRNEDYLDFVRGLPCCATGVEPAEPHHIDTGGTGMKCSDYLVIPLSRSVHREMNGINGGKDLLLSKYNIDQDRVAMRILIEYLHNMV